MLNTLYIQLLLTEQWILIPEKGHLMQVCAECILSHQFSYAYNFWERENISFLQIYGLGTAIYYHLVFLFVPSDSFLH